MENTNMNFVEAILTETTCGEACWQAREDICRCSCGGKNHGCMRTADGTRPTRNAKIDGFRYELKAVGTDLYSQAREIISTLPKRKIGTYEYRWEPTDKGSPVRLKSATRQQIDKWPELQSFKDNLKSFQEGGNKCYAEVMREWPSLLWERI
jgi:hypothetical protein